MIYDNGVDRTNFDSSGLSTGYAEGEIMTECENKILSLAKSQFIRVADFSVADLGYQWQSDMIARTESLKSAFVDTFRSRQAEIMQNMRKSVYNGFSVGVRDSKRSLASAGIRYPDREYSLNDAREGQNTLLTSFNNILHAQAQAIAGAVSDYILAVNMIAAAQYGTVREVYDRTFVPAVEKGLPGKVTKNGAKLGLANYTEGLTRETSQQALLMGESAVANAAGQYLVRISRHASSCPKCEPYQGAILIDDVYADGRADGVHELLSVAIANGLFHWNCRHKKTVWIPGESVVPPDKDDYDASKVARNYELEQQQRALERQIREQKRIQSSALDQQTVKSAEKRQAELQADLTKLIQDGKKQGLAVYRQPHKEAAGFRYPKSLPFG